MHTFFQGASMGALQKAVLRCEGFMPLQESLLDECFRVTCRAVC